MKLMGSAERGLSEMGSSAGHFFFLTCHSLPFGPRGPCSDLLLLSSRWRCGWWRSKRPSLIPLTWGKTKVGPKRKHIYNHKKEKKWLENKKTLKKILSIAIQSAYPSQLEHQWSPYLYLTGDRLSSTYHLYGVEPKYARFLGAHRSYGT